VGRDLAYSGDLHYFVVRRRCRRSHNGAAWAVKNGCTNVYRYPGGTFAWKGAKYLPAAAKSLSSMQEAEKMKTLPVSAAELPALIGERARNLFLKRRMYCSEAVLVTLNQALGGSLDEYQALALAAPFSEGIGKSGCMCGAVGGALMALGLFIGGTNPERRRSAVQRASGEFMDRFKARFGSSCCRILTKKNEAAFDSSAARCSAITAQAAALAAGMILAKRPELARVADVCFLNSRDSTVGGLLKKALRTTGAR
jgi:C_GCAxxG_C_C family probable redox protein